MTPSASSELAGRVNTSVLAGAEKRLLTWIAERLPQTVNSDHLTVLGGLGMLGVGVCFWAGAHSRPAIAGVVPLLALNWFGDSLDGTLARVRRVERPRYGYYVDHVLDAIGFAALVAGLILGQHMSQGVGLAFLCAYYLLVIEVALSAHARGAFRLSFWHIGPTELRILLAAGALALLRSPTVTLFGSSWLLFDVGGLCGTACLVLTFAAAACSSTKALYQQEPLRART
jgi:archaetidylinositol phosphate synthase